MQVVLLTTFRASRKEPLETVLGRVHQAFADAALEPPVVTFSFSDSPIEGGVSSVDRVLKRHPELRRFLSTHSVVPGIAPVRQISNEIGSAAPGEPLVFSTILSIAAGVPRSFPFHNISIHFGSPAFGAALAAPPFGHRGPGVLVGDAWWVNGRTRSVSALSSVEVEGPAKRLPPHPPGVAAVLAACGKVQKTLQVPIISGLDQQTTTGVALPDVAEAVRKVVIDYRTRLSEVVARAALPHDLPPALDAQTLSKVGDSSGPKKPALVEGFGPLGYDCRGDWGTFALRRRTPSNLTLEISLDVGTWSNSLTAFYKVYGLGFRALLPLPASRRAGAGQYPIGGPERWRQIVENLAVLVQELERTFVPAIEAVAGPVPEWYRPEV